MKPIRWNSEKSHSLKADRGVSFEEVLSAISQGSLIAVMDHPGRAKYGHQRMLVVAIRDYAYLVPYVESENEIFLKSIMPSRRRRAASYREASEMNGEKLLEQEILASFERGEWRSVRNQKGEIARIRASASATLLKNKRVNIRISSLDLEGLQARAAEEGVPYQTLMASVLHKFVSGRLVEAQKRIPTRSSRTARKRTAA